MSHNAYIESNDGSHNGDFSALEDYWRLLSPSATEDTRPTSTVEDMPPSPGDYTVDPRHIMRQPFSGPSTDIEYPHLKSVGTWDSSPAVDTQSSNGTSIGETPSGAHNDPARESLPDGGQVTFTDKEFASPSSGGYLMCQLQTRVLSFTQRLPELSATVSPSPPQTTTEQQSAQTRNTPSKRRLREDQSPATVLSGLPQTTAQQPLNKKPRNLSEGQLAEDTSSATATLSGSQTVAQPKSSRSTKSKNVGVSGKPKKICVPCQVLHQKCDIHDGKDGRCGGCISAGKDGRLCQPHYLSQLECFRKGNSRVGQDRSRHIPLTLVRDDNPEREISIQPFFQNAEEVPSLTILCKRFKVERSMTLVERFEASDGKSFPVSSRPYASNKVAKTFDEDVKGWLERCEKPAMDDLLVADIENGSRTEATGMARWTITESRRIVDVKPGSNPVLSSALTILACAWLSGKQAIIVGDEKLDMKAVEEENSYITGKVPVPAYLDCQLDNATIAHMERHMKKVVNGLKSLMGLGGGKPKSSLETFFTVFILLYTIELVYTLQIRYMRRHSKRDCQDSSCVKHTSYIMIGRWKESAQNLLVHFWAGLGGMEVSLDVWESKLRQGSPDERPKAKVDELMSLIRSHGAELSQIRARNHIWDSDGDIAHPNSEDYWGAERYLEGNDPERLGLLAYLFPDMPEASSADGEGCSSGSGELRYAQVQDFGLGFLAQ